MYFSCERVFRPAVGKPLVVLQLQRRRVRRAQRGGQGPGRADGAAVVPGAAPASAPPASSPVGELRAVRRHERRMMTIEARLRAAAGDLLDRRELPRLRGRARRPGRDRARAARRGLEGWACRPAWASGRPRRSPSWRTTSRSRPSASPGRTPRTWRRSATWARWVPRSSIATLPRRMWARSGASAARPARGCTRRACTRCSTSCAPTRRRCAGSSASWSRRRCSSCAARRACPSTTRRGAPADPVSRSFGKAVTSMDGIIEAVSEFASRAAEKLRGQESVCGAIHVFFATSPFRQNDRQHGQRHDPAGAADGRHARPGCTAAVTARQHPSGRLQLREGGRHAGRPAAGRRHGPG